MMSFDEIKDELRAWKHDEIFKLLSSRCSLTRKQIETLLIDIIVDAKGIKMKAEEKAKIRGVSKGAFVRTKKQAIDNIRRALYTVLLLGYLGVLELPTYSWFVQASEAFSNGDVESVCRLLSELMRVKR